MGWASSISRVAPVTCRRALRDLSYPLYNLAQILAVTRAEHEVCCGEVGNDVGRSPAVRDDAVDTRVITQVLPEGVNTREKMNDGVEGIDAVMGRNGGVGRLAVVGEPVADHREAPTFLDGDRIGNHGAIGRRMRRKRDVHIAERARVNHADLSAAALFRRRAKHLYAAGEARHKCLECESRADVGDGDQVVAAAVADLRQGIVFGQERDRWARPSAALKRRPKGRLHSAGASFNRKAVSLHRIRQQSGGIKLLVVELRMGVDILADANQLVTQLVNGG